MELDDLKATWAAHGALLEKSLAIDERLLRELMLRKVRLALAPYVLWRALEVVVGIATLAVALPIFFAHFAEPRYLFAAGALVVFTLVITARSATLLVHALGLDLGGAVTAIQRDVERIRLVEYRTLKWAVLGGVVIWLPAALVAFEAMSGVDALARVDLAWLVSNLIFGLVVLALGQRWSKRHVERPDLKPWARRLMEALSGRGLRSAAGHLAELSNFEREETQAS